MKTLLLTLALRNPRTPVAPPSNEEIFANWQWITDAEPLMSVPWAVVAISFILLIVLTVKLVQWRKAKNRQDGPLLVFNQVARKLGLDISSQWVLIRMAQQQNLPTPLTLLICDSTFSYHAKSYVKSFPPNRQKSILNQLKTVHHHLFAMPERS